MDGARSVLKSSDVMDGVPDLLPLIQVEAVFTTAAGWSASTTRSPEGAGKNRLNGQRGGTAWRRHERSAKRSQRCIPSLGTTTCLTRRFARSAAMSERRARRAQPGRPRITLKVRNTATGRSRWLAFPFLRDQPLSRFDRRAAFGLRFDIPANTAVRFEPGDEKQVTLVPFGAAASSAASTTWSTAGQVTARILTIAPIRRRRRAGRERASSPVARRPSLRLRQSQGKVQVALPRPVLPLSQGSDMTQIPRRQYADLDGPTSATRSGSATLISTSRSKRTCAPLRRRTAVWRRQDAAGRHGLGQPADFGGRVPRSRHHQRHHRRRDVGVVKAMSGCAPARSSASARPATRRPWTG